MPETITIPVYEYNDFIAMAERISTLERLYASNGFVSDKDVKTILCISNGEE